MNTSGKISLCDVLSNLTAITRITNSSVIKPITGYADLFPRKENKQENVLLTIEAIINPMSVKSFLKKNPDAELSICIREAIGLALPIEQCSIILTHAQTTEKEFTIFVVVHPLVQWFTTLNEQKFTTYTKELRRFNREKNLNQVEVFSTN